MESADALRVVVIELFFDAQMIHIYAKLTWAENVFRMCKSNFVTKLYHD